ncbi:MAG: YihY/virulence factor BrkB family protein [Chitinophagaceae bacterium]|jgi:membrane protein|nr:YihY/virulence factor BrkB family protein [Chitinophagaceae bacterium]
MTNRFYSIWKILHQTVNDFIDNKVLRMSAALAYYTVFALAPMLIIIIGLTDFFWGGKPEGTIVNQLSSFVGGKTALQIQILVQKVRLFGNTRLASIISMVILLFSATGVFTEIQDSINIIWHLKSKHKKGRGVLKFVINRLLSFSLVISLGFILLVSLVLNALLDALSHRLFLIFPESKVYVSYIITSLLTFFTTTLLFAIIFKLLPDAKIKWRDVFTGAVTTALLFMLGKMGIGYYLKKSSIVTAYGAAGSVVVILLWVYYSAIILYFGATFTRIYTLHKGRKIYPNDYAVWVEQIEVAHTSEITEK